MRKKIGLLTFHKSINYGSVLQAWALTKTISKKYNVEVIDYKPNQYEYLYNLYRSWNTINNFKYNLKRIPLRKAIKNQSYLFKKFREEQLPLSQIEYNSANADEVANYYNAIVVGSDQVWNLRAKDCDSVFFLPFSFKGKKVSYACSINDTDYTEERCSDDLRNQICDFDFISVREKSGSEKLQNYILNKKKVYTLLDPTLLCNKEEFESLLSERIVKENYIFLYNVWTSEAGIQAAKYISEKFNMPVYTIMTASNIKEVKFLEENGIIVEKVKTSPSDFLNFFRYASYVVTESFHGTAFSLIFERPFVCVSKRTNDERLVNILELVDLKNRYIKPKDLTKFDFTLPIDYVLVNERRHSKANDCIKVLYQAIEGEKES